MVLVRVMDSVVPYGVVVVDCRGKVCGVLGDCIVLRGICGECDLL